MTFAWQEISATPMDSVAFVRLRWVLCLAELLESFPPN